MSETIYFNGKKYNSIAEMPPEVRQTFEKFNRLFLDADSDGIPDMVQSGGLSGLKETFSTLKDIAQIGSTEGFTQDQFFVVRETDAGIFVNGKGYRSVEEMPDYVRTEYERIVGAAQDGQMEIFDETWREVDREEYFKPHDDEIFNRPRSSRIPSSNAPIESVDSTSRFLIIAAIAILMIGCLAFVWFMYLNL